MQLADFASGSGSKWPQEIGQYFLVNKQVATSASPGRSIDYGRYRFLEAFGRNALFRIDLEQAEPREDKFEVEF